MSHIPKISFAYNRLKATAIGYMLILHSNQRKICTLIILAFNVSKCEFLVLVFLWSQSLAEMGICLLCAVTECLRRELNT